MLKINEWQEFFDAHAPQYLENVFTKNTLPEVEFLIQELRLPPGGRVLDMGCGTGRHAIELAKRGYRVTGVDISSGMLAEANTAAQNAAVRVEWIQADAAQFNAAQFADREKYDAAVCLCEGAFGLLSSADDPMEHDLAILKNIHAALKPGGRMILTALNGYRLARQYNDEDVTKGTFDPLFMVETTAMEYHTPEGTRSIKTRERAHLPTELRLLFHQAGFQIDHLGGGTAGKWGKRPLELDEMELMIIARKGNPGR